LESVVAGESLFAGPRAIQIEIDGRPVAGNDPYEVTCWISDSDIDYLELRCTLGEVVVVEHQILLDRAGRFALLADAVMAPAGARIDVQSSLALVRGLRVEAGRRSRECWIRGGRRMVRLVPLWLPQWRTQSTVGDLEQDDETLRLRGAGAGHRFYLPTVLDWHPGRRRFAAQWRSLTVSQGRRIVPPSFAVGYRLRLGDDQWLLYRSLGNRGVRCLLGHQTRCQFVLGRVDRQGALDPLLEII
jgi:hypothetical protein